MLTNQDFRELLKLFIDRGVEYLVVGGYAVMKYTEPRFTKDLDLWISPTKENAQAVYDTLKEFGAPLKGLSPKDFTDKSCYYQMGRPPFRLDIIMDLSGMDFDSAWQNREDVLLTDLKISFISKKDLMRAKQLSGRPQDLLDLENLRKTE